MALRLGADQDNAVRELSEAEADGVDTIIDLMTPDLGRDVEFVRDVAQAAGINIVVATGISRDVPRSFWERSLDRIADIFVREIEIGIGETGIKARVIKIANDNEGVTPAGERVLRGAARALKRTGCLQHRTTFNGTTRHERLRTEYSATPTFFRAISA